MPLHLLTAMSLNLDLPIKIIFGCNYLVHGQRAACEGEGSGTGDYSD